ncbi:MAG TPA: hypothetical protein DD409_06475 [Bacteroidales bacterium]|nr:MAG: hypothetical protein BWY72_00027 [Bacteroidetes bacterium ADurb.Bin416]HBL72531.1 hypothetical protein [Bacteroidales bacterium]
MRNVFSIHHRCLTVLLLMFALVAKAQFDGQFSQYMLNPALFNPAAIGEGEELVVNLTNRQQWTSIDNAPKTFLLNASLPKLFGASRHGFGLLIMNETYGLFSTQLLQAQYAYRKPLWNGLLGVGVQGGMLQQVFDAGGIYIPSSEYHVPGDPSKPAGNLEGMIPDINLGLWFSHPRFHTGLSVSHLTGMAVKLKEGEETPSEDAYKFVPARTYYLTGGYNIQLSNPLYTLQPSFLLKTDLTAWQADLSARLTYKDTYWGMAGWRPQDAVIVSAGVKLPQGLSIGYAYDISLALWGASGGSHEIFLRYARRIETASVSKKQKSIRIL